MTQIVETNVRESCLLPLDLEVLRDPRGWQRRSVDPREDEIEVDGRLSHDRSLEPLRIPMGAQDSRGGRVALD